MQKNLAITEIKVDKELKSLVPRLNSEDYQALKENISKHGILDTLKVNADFVLLDGHTRYQIAKELNIEELPVKTLKFDNIWDEKEFVITANTDRRQLTKAQLAELALKLADIEKEKAKERQRELGTRSGVKGADFGFLGGRGIKKGSKEYNEKAVQLTNTQSTTKNPLRFKSTEGGYNTQGSPEEKDNQADVNDMGKALEIAAKKVKIGYSTIWKAHKIKKEAEENPQIKKAWEDAKKGEKSINSVYKTLQKKVQIEKAKKTYINSTKGDNPPTLYHQDAVEFLTPLENNSIDLLLTDPPYSTDIEDINAFAKSWLPLALQKLKPTGRAYIFIGAYPHELKAYIDILLSQDRFILDNHLIWTYKNTLGQTPKMKYNLNYQVILHLYSNKSRPLDISITKEMFSVMEFNAPDGRQGERLHSWQKPLDLAKMLIRHSTVENEVVVDCFAGTGTFVLAANQMNRQAYGCDLSIENLNIAKERGCEILDGKVKKIQKLRRIQDAGR